MRAILSTSALLAILVLPILPMAAADAPAETPVASGEKIASSEAKPFLGVVVRPVAEAGFDGASGLVVDRVFPRTTAAELGLQRGDTLIRFNEQAVTTRDRLKTILESIKVGDKVTANYQRDGQTINGAAVLHARPSHESVSKNLDEAKATVTELQQQRVAQLQDLSAARKEERSLAEAMLELSQTLQELPEKLDLTAQQFKAVYPDGEFTVDITIRIRSHPDNPEAIDLSPRLPPPTNSERKQAAERKAAAGTGNQAAVAPEEDGLMPPPTKPVTPE